MTKNGMCIRDRNVEMPERNRVDRPELTVHGWGFHHLAPDRRGGGAYTPITEELLVRVLRGLEGLAG
ncbi:hypothetical protein [Streptomyces sp. 150FB]|uniref:hypothetical protein n=1 Tax=Streptomyces sp. 150FB TaxID=1576605 RepID=UPI001237763B|nr:hypothetical protein [Streptomyces sp. 150FB]